MPLSDHPLLRKMGYDTDYEYAWVCFTCKDLYERDRPDGYNQACQCRKEQDSRDDWPGDFARHVELCRCCGVIALRSGSRWSPFFCPKCRDAVKALSLWEGRLVIPVGRHSLMHTWVPHSKPSNLVSYKGDAKALAEDVMASLGSINSRQGLTLEWRRVIVGQTLKQLGFGRDVSLRDYLLKAAQEELDEASPRRGLAGLIEMVQAREAVQD